MTVPSNKKFQIKCHENNPREANRKYSPTERIAENKASEIFSRLFPPEKK